MTCEFCAEMDGKVVGIDSNYLNNGAELVGADGGIMTAGITVRHPPLHPHCRCALIPVVI